jgi:hypothetical protein
MPEVDILHGQDCENPKSHTSLTGWALHWRANMAPVRYGLGFYITKDDIAHSHRRENLKSYIALTGWTL